MLGKGMLGKGMLGKGMLGKGMLGKGMLGKGMLGKGMLGEGMLGKGMLGKGMLGKGMLNRGIGKMWLSNSLALIFPCHSRLRRPYRQCAAGGCAIPELEAGQSLCQLWRRSADRPFLALKYWIADFTR
jgi:hypothetical protein